MKNPAERLASELPEEQAKKIMDMYRYAERTVKDPFVDSPYQIRFNETFALLKASEVSLFDALWFAFDFGRAKGYREGRKHR